MKEILMHDYKTCYLEAGVGPYRYDSCNQQGCESRSGYYWGIHISQRLEKILFMRCWDIAEALVSPKSMIYYLKDL